MSVVVAIKHNDSVFVGTDSLITGDGSSKIQACNNNTKIWHADPEKRMVLGTVGSLYEANLIRTFKAIFKDAPYQEKDLFEFLVRDYVPKLHEDMWKMKNIRTKEDSIRLNNTILVARDGELYTISASGTVLEISQHVAIGSAQYEVLGSLAVHKHLSPRKRIALALRTAIDHDLYVDYPILITSTKDSAMETLTKEEVKTLLNGI